MSRILRTSHILAWLFLTGTSLAAILIASFYLYLRPGLPSVEQLTDIKLQTPLRVYSADNRLIAEFGEKRRAPITIEQIPTIQLHAYLAAEDANFYEHVGVDFKGLLRAAIELVTTGHIQSGGSTITMQVAKNYFLSRDRTFIRKFNEILLAIQIERELEKNQILELYLNKIYLGNRAYGIQAAAQVYYNRDVSELSLAQMAMLAGLPKAPSAFNPLANPERALIRRNWILGRMKELGYINDDAYRLASAAPLTAQYNAPDTQVDADYVAEMARADMVQRFGEAAYTDGYSVTLTVNSRNQQAATTALRHGIEAYDYRHGFRGAIGRITELQRPEDELVRELNIYPRIEELYPAVVQTVSDENNNVELLARSLGNVQLNMADMTWAREHRTENYMGPEPQKPSDVLSAGDVVYVTPKQIETNSEPDTADEQENAGQPPRASQVILAQLPNVQGALISLNAKSGAIEALAGGYSFSQSKYNRAIQASRQPGSTFKPFLYLAALERGLTPATVFNDAPIVFDDSELETAWRPENSSGQFYGPTRLREALYRSRNLVSIRLLRDIGLQHTFNYIEALGIPTDNMQRDLSLALGSGLLTPMDVARGFAVIANGGYDVQPYLIQEIRDSNNQVVYEAPSVILCERRCQLDEFPPSAGDAANIRTARRLADERSVYLLHSMLRDVVRRGTGRRALALGRNDIGGKTGTTNEQRDTWFSGFNHDMATTAWIGFDQPNPLGRSEYGATTALPVWLEYMTIALEGKPAAFMPQPNGLVSVRIDPTTGQRARPGQEGAIFEMFKEENAPAPLAPTANTNGNGLGTDGDDATSLPQELF
ncbi:penicillin-binding protein 1A [Marinobacter zhejiangensis]|uniref:Penicillin-binding protein 1A n=1 Tax=Marinobacter zhejiangensis TaxID=488535 RepID=A0A1I4SAQ2_9GAMM|nr:penicillin-binding protein 1A [Marinobacter zhejiangensis]SFM61374.1 penicillin-binding protein 1A [Marinobacter zhejiangensis]